MLKKILKITGISLLVLVLTLAAVPYLFKDKIKALITKTLNENVNATIAFKEVNLNLFNSFPRACVSVDQLSIITKAPFENDTLLYTGTTQVTLNLKELFKTEGETVTLESFSIIDGIVNLIYNEEGIANFDIALKEKTDKKNNDSKPFALHFQEYELKNLNFTYTDRGTKLKMAVDQINHEGKGNFAAQKLDLETKTTALLSFEMDHMRYLKNVAIALEAVVGIDVEKNKFEFKDTTALINQLPLAFNGFVQMTETGQTYDLKFKTPTSDFKNFLGLVPAAYAGDLKNVRTTGQFSVSGTVKGDLTDATLPAFDLKMIATDASFHYPNLPKKVENIKIDTHIINKTGLLNDTYINLNHLSFAIDQDVFTAKAVVKNIAENALVDAELKGTINLAHVTQAYPVKLDQPLTGILKADVATKFDMQSVEKNQYENIQNSGTINLKGYNYEGPELAKPFRIKEANMAFNPNHIRLTKFDATTGTSDLQALGTLDNFYGFMFKNQILKGTFNLNAAKFVVSDFMAPTTSTSEEGKKTTEAVKIPSFLDCSITAKAQTVVYDHLILKAVSGTLVIKEETVALNGLKMNVFDGAITVSGRVSTKEKTPTFAVNLGLEKVNIAESCSQLEVLKAVAPIAGAIQGKLNAAVQLTGALQQDMTPNLNSLSGNLKGQLLSATLNEKNSELLTQLGKKIKFLDLSKLNLNDVKASMTFKEGKVSVQPFDLKHEDLKVSIGGTHGFDQSLNYSLVFDVPVKYLGTDATRLFAKLSPSDQNKIKNIPINALLTGTFSQPKISTDLTQATTAFASQVVKMQKDNYINQGTTALSNLINGTKGNKGATTATDSTKTTTTPKETVKNNLKDKANDVLNGWLKKKKKE